MNKNILILILLVVLGYFVYQQYSPKFDAPSNKQSGGGLYDGSKFSFNYPNELTLFESSNEVRITSIPIPKVNETTCQQLEDEQARASCRNPASNLSPNITIKFLAGNPSILWEEAKIGTEEETQTIGSHVYRVNHISGEYGGRRVYGLFLDNGLLFASFNHEDFEGGNIFIKSDEYQLDHHQQRELLEQILLSLVLK